MSVYNVETAAWRLFHFNVILFYFRSTRIASSIFSSSGQHLQKWNQGWQESVCV